MAVQRTDWHNTQRTNTLAPDPLRCRLSKISIENLTHMPIGKTSFLPFLSGPIQHAQRILRPVWGTPPDIRGPGLLGQFKCRVYMHLVDLNMQLMYTGVVPDPLFFCLQLVSLPERPRCLVLPSVRFANDIVPTELTDVGGISDQFSVQGSVLFFCLLAYELRSSKWWVYSWLIRPFMLDT
jgi:hypothetical protein